MSTLVLARKYRPRRFAEMVGQEHVVQALVNALTQQRLHHAYLFTGTRGVGKTTVARILAKSLNCTGPDGNGGITAEPCGVCDACSQIDSGRFVDYTELDAASNRGVDEVQQLLEQAVYKPVQGRIKVFMIDEVHMLTGHAFNAMLKTLEEPPDYLKFVLATTDPQKVPVTVLSRCLQFNLRSMAPETIAGHLRHVLQAEQVEFEQGALMQIARSARGSMRDALSLTDQAIAYGGGNLQEAAVRSMLGSVERSLVLALIAALAQGDGRSVVEGCDALRAQGLSAASALEDLCSVLHDMAVMQMAPKACLDDATDSESTQVMQLAHNMAPDDTQLLYSLCLHGRTELGLASDEYAALTMVLLRLLAFRPAVETASPEKKSLKTEMPVARAVQPLPVRDAVARPARAQREQAKPAAAQTAPADGATNMLAVPVREAAPSQMDASPSAVTASLQPNADGTFWFGVVQQLLQSEAISALTRELAMQAQLVARDADQWLLRVERESLNQVSSRERLTQALHGAGHAVQLVVEVGRITDNPARRLAQAHAERQLAAEQTVLQDANVQQLQHAFGAKIVPGSVRPL